MPSRELTEILALVPHDFADPEADYRAVRAMMAPFHGHPVPAHVTVTRGGARRGALRLVRGRAPAPARRASSSTATAAAWCRARSTTTTSTARMLAEQLEARVRHGGLPAGPGAPLSRRAPRLPRRLPRAAAPAASTRPTWWSAGTRAAACWGWARCSSARDEGLALPACFVSISGWFDVSVADPVEDGTATRSSPRQWVRNRGREYAAGRVALDDPRLSPVYADLAGLPPLYLPTGQYDTLRHGTEALAQAALTAGVAVTAESWPGMVHGWQGLVSAGVPEAVAAFARAARLPRRPRGVTGQPPSTVRSRARRRSGSARMSRATIFPPRTVKAPTENATPSRVVTAPATPFTSAGWVEQAEVREDHGPARHGRRAAHRAGGAGGDRDGPLVGPDHDVGVEHGEQGLEVAVARGGQEGVDHFALALEVGVGDGLLALDAPAGAAGQLAGRLGERSTIGAISSKGTAKMSCRTKASRSAGVNVSSTTSRATPTESARSASCSGSAAPGRSRMRSGMCGPTGSSRRVRRARRMLSATRETTVVSQARRFSTSPCRCG